MLKIANFKFLEYLLKEYFTVYNKTIEMEVFYGLPPLSITTSTKLQKYLINHPKNSQTTDNLGEFVPQTLHYLLLPHL